MQTLHQLLCNNCNKSLCIMSNSKDIQREQEQELGKQAIRLANSVVLPMVLKSVIELNVLDILFTSGEGAFLSPSEVASRLPTKNPDAPVLLDRMLRLLASYDVLKCSVRTGENGQIERLYGAGPICKFLINNEGGGSVGPTLSLNNDKVFMESWYHLNEAVLEGVIPFEKAHGMATFEYTEIDQRFNSLFNRTLSNQTTLTVNTVLDVYKGFEELKVLVDVGGGIGVTLSMITSKYPHLKGINFDLPHVVANAPSYSGVEHVGGDMFLSVPKGDAFLMKWILHLLSDEQCLKLLKNCWESLPNFGKVIIIESILPVAPENSVSTHIVLIEDLWMLTLLPGGKVRTHKDFETLALKSGFSSCEVVCSAYDGWVIEFNKGAYASTSS